MAHSVQKLAHTSVVVEGTMLVCASFFFFFLNGSSYSLLPNFKIKQLLHNQNSIAATKSKIQNLVSPFNTYSIQNSFFLKHNNSKYLHNISLFMHTLESCYNILQLRQILLYIILFLLQVY